MSGRLNHSSTESQSGSPAMSGWHWPARIRSDPNRSGALRRQQWSSMTNTCRPWQSADLDKSATPRCRSGRFGCPFTERLLCQQSLRISVWCDGGEQIRSRVCRRRAGPGPIGTGRAPATRHGHRYGNAVSDRPRFPHPCHKDGDTGHLRPEPDRVHSRGGTNDCASGCCTVL
jgi:hypothetical protein